MRAIWNSICAFAHIGKFRSLSLHGLHDVQAFYDPSSEVTDAILLAEKQKQNKQNNLNLKSRTKHSTFHEVYCFTF